MSRQNPFSLYDFLGYFIPGAVTLYSILFAYFHATHKSFDYQSLADTFNLIGKDSYLPFIMAAYILGHLLSFVSSIVIEKYSIWTHGYPSKYLLGLPPAGYFSYDEHKISNILVRIFIACIIFPIAFFDFILGASFNFRQFYIKQIGDGSIEVVKKTIAKLYCMFDFDDFIQDDEWYSKKDYFRLCYHYALENAPYHNPKMQNYVALYGFTRTISFIFVLLFWLFVWHIVASRLSLGLSFILPISSGFIAYIFYIAFNKFYRRYSMESLMAMTISLINREMP